MQNGLCCGCADVDTAYALGPPRLFAGGDSCWGRSVTISIRYQGDLQCEATHHLSRTVLLTDAPTEDGGEGASFSPTDLAAGALGTCVLTVMGALARAHGVDITGARAEVGIVMAASPGRIGALSVHVDVSKRVAGDAQAKLERAALVCPVKISLHPDIAVTMTFSWA